MWLPFFIVLENKAQMIQLVNSTVFTSFINRFLNCCVCFVLDPRVYLY